MKQILVALTAVLMLSGFSGSVKAQGKMGHVNTMELMQMMPEMDSIQRQLQTYGKELEDNIATMQAEFQNKYAEFQNNQSQWSDLIKQTKAKEINDMQVRIQEFMQQAEEDYKQRTNELLEPISEKVKNAIEAVAREGKFAYILDSSNATLFAGSESNDVMSLVKKKLGLPDVPVNKTF
ncbi:MAG: OmpH family outer membrane protein [Bacteroidales bacterium]|nr:OmpH family outer membrane protein [Bacteroidales bacterium]